jgi:hypothetical protein
MTKYFFYRRRILIILLTVWPALRVIMTNFNCPETKTFFASFLRKQLHLNIFKFLLRRLQAITNGESNLIKC